MKRSNENGLEMRQKQFFFCFLLISVVVLLWKLHSLQTEIHEVHELRDFLIENRHQLQLTYQQLISLENRSHAKTLSKLLGPDAPVIYCITPTYQRAVQKAELTRISQTLMLVPSVHWVVIEDANEKSELVVNLLADSGLVYTHLYAKTPPFEQLRDRDPRWKKHRGVEQRNAGLNWLRKTLEKGSLKGVVYFMDDDNTYSIKLFREIAKVKHVGVWPVGLVGGLNAESPVLDPNTGKVVKFRSGWKQDRLFAIDMAGFAINLDLILEKKGAVFSYNMEKGCQESQFLSYFTTREELEPLADNCTKVYVWHTRTEKPDVRGVIKGLEV